MTMMGSIDACLGVLADVLKILGIVSSRSLYVLIVSWCALIGMLYGPISECVHMQLVGKFTYGILMFWVLSESCLWTSHDPHRLP